MRVFVAGATGVVGRRAIPLLVAAGHDVSGIARSAEREAQLRRLGATPVAVDVFDATAVRGAVEGHDAVCNLLTHIPPTSRMALPGAWAENDRLRSEASRHLADAAAQSGGGRIVQESIPFVYADGGDAWLDEQAPVDAGGYLASSQVAEANAATVTTRGGVGVVLRFAAFYGPDSDQSLVMIRLARRRMAAGAGAEGFYSSVTTDDAASAVVAALGAPAGTYNVADDEPLRRREYFGALAAAIGAKPPRIAPAWLAKAGGSRAAVVVRSQRVSNARFKEATGWAPATPDARQGWRDIVAAVGPNP